MGRQIFWEVFFCLWELYFLYQPFMHFSPWIKCRRFWKFNTAQHKIWQCFWSVWHKSFWLCQYLWSYRLDNISVFFAFLELQLWSNNFQIRQYFWSFLATSAELNSISGILDDDDVEWIINSLQFSFSSWTSE